MKTQLLVASFIVSTFITAAQNNDLTFNVTTEKMTPTIKELNLGNKGGIYLENFNPFLYTISVDKKHSDTSSKFVPSIINIFGSSFGATFPTIPKFEKGNMEALGQCH